MQKYKTQLHLPRLRKKKPQKKHVLLRSNVSEHVLRRWIEAKDAVMYTLGLRKKKPFFFFCATLFVSALIKHEGTYGAQFVLALMEEEDKRRTRRTTTTTTTSFLQMQRLDGRPYLVTLRCHGARRRRVANRL